MKNFLGIFCFLVFGFGSVFVLPAAAQTTSEPTILNEVQRTQLPRSSNGATRTSGRSKLNCRPVLPEQASGWRATNGQGRTVNFRLQPALCTNLAGNLAGTNLSSAYILQWMTEGVDNPRNPNQVILFANDFRELFPMGKMVLFKGFFGDLFDAIKGAIDYIKRVIKAAQKLVKDWDAVKELYQQIVNDLGEFTTALVGKSNEKPTAQMIAQMARLKKQGNLLPHQIYGGGLAAGMNESRAFTDAFVELANQLKTK